MVSAVRCPNPKCRKYMLVEDTDRGKVLPCLICKKPIQVPSPAPAAPPAPPAPPAKPDPEPKFVFDDD